MGTVINIEIYSDEQLLEALTSVDDEVYFEHALLIYQTLLNRKGWHHVGVSAERLGFGHNSLFYWFWAWLANTPFSLTVFAELDEESRRMDEKITRLNTYLDAQQSEQVYQT